MTKYQKLHKLKDEMEKDDSLPLKTKDTKLVFGTGNTEAEILCIGEGPGFNENLQGLPFVGQAGKLLDKLLLMAGLERKQVFITNVVHHRPPENRDPTPQEIEAYGKYLDQIIDVIKPRIIITLGRFSMAKFLPGVFISSVHGKTYNLKWKNRDVLVVPMYHPAASLRNGDILNKEKEDFFQLKETLSRIREEESKNQESKVRQEELI